MPGGRPSKYKPEFCESLVEFFSVEPFTEREIEHFKGGKKSWTDIKRFANRLPTLRRWAKSVDVGISTVYRWVDKDSDVFQAEFRDAFNEAKELRKWFLIENGLQGLYNSYFAVFVAKNITDMRDTHEVKGSLSLRDFLSGSGHEEAG